MIIWLWIAAILLHVISGLVGKAMAVHRDHNSPKFVVALSIFGPLGWLYIMKTTVIKKDRKIELHNYHV